MSAVVVCLHCAHYQKGGYCRKKRRDISALQTACENALAPDYVPEDALLKITPDPVNHTKKCAKCGKDLQLSEYEYTRSNKGEKIRRRTCKTCYHEIMKCRHNKNKKNKEDMNVETKHCKKCGQDLPISAFGKKAGTKDGLQYWCKTCTTKAILDARKSKKAAKEQEQPTPTKEQEQPTPTKEQTKNVVAHETLTDKQMVQALRAHGWEVTCKRTITEEL